MSQAPLVTVVIPAYEAGDEVRAAVDSVLAQTVRDVEILVIDDGSRHHPVPADLPDDSRIVVDRQDVNRGYAWVTNHANARARGEWVTYVDADDVIDARHLELLLEAGRRHDADTVFAPLRCIRDGKDIGTLRWQPPGAVSDAAEAIRRVLREEVTGSQHVLMRAPTAIAPSGATYSDWVFLLRHLQSSRAVAYVDEPLYRYTISSSSASAGASGSIWELTELPRLAEPTIRSTFDTPRADVLVAGLDRLVITQMLHKSALQPADSPLHAEVIAWCRQRMTWSGVGQLARHGHHTAAASWALAKLSPRLHRRAYQAYDARKG